MVIVMKGKLKQVIERIVSSIIMISTLVWVYAAIIIGITFSERKKIHSFTLIEKKEIEASD